MNFLRIVTWILSFTCMFVWLQKMGGREGGLNQTGKKVREKQVHLSTQLESGLETQMIKVMVPLVSFSVFVIWIPSSNYVCMCVNNA